MNIDRLFQLLTILAVLAFAVISTLRFLLTTREEGIGEAVRGLFSWSSLVRLFGILLLALLSASAVFIQPQEVGVVVSALSPSGYRPRPLAPGLRFVVPLVEETHIYPVYWQTYTMSRLPLEGEKLGDDSITARTSDGQEVSLDCSIIFRIDGEQVNRVHIGWQDRYIQDLVRPLTRGIIRTEVSQFTVDEVNSSKRLDLETSLDERMSEALEENGFILDRFLLRNIAFSIEYATSVEQKQVAEQRRIQTQHQADQIRNLAEGEADKVKILAQAEADARVIRARAEADARVIEARADMQALQLVTEVLAQNPDLLTYTYVQKLSPSIRTMLLPADTPLILPLPTMDPEGGALPTPSAIETTVPITTPEFITPTVVVETPTPVPTLTPSPTPTPQTGQ